MNSGLDGIIGTEKAWLTALSLEAGLVVVVLASDAFAVQTLFDAATQFGELGFVGEVVLSQLIIGFIHSQRFFNIIFDGLIASWCGHRGRGIDRKAGHRREGES